MYYSPDKLKRFSNHSEIRSEFINTSFPNVLSDDILADFGVFPLDTTKPTYDETNQTTNDLGDIYDAGSWKIQWEVVDLTPERIEEIRKANVPQSVTMRQARLALRQAGLLDDVTAAINALPSPIKEDAQIEWEYSQEVQRHNGFVSQLAPILGLDELQLDSLFVTAKGL